MVLRSFSCRKRNKSNSDDEDQDKVPRQNSDVATTSSKIKRAKTLDNDDTNSSKVMTSLTPPPNAMKDAVHTSQYGDKFPPEVRPLLEEWKKQYLNVKNGKSLDAAYEDTLTTDAESQCEIVGCEYIRTYHRYCALHYSLAESVQRLVLGLYCSNTGCINKAAFAKRYDGKDLCTSCKSRSKHDDEDDTLEGTEEEIRKHAREMGLPKVIQRYNELQLMYPDATITLYTGQSIDTDRRFKQHDYTPITKDYVDALKVKQVSSIYEANPYEHELIKASAEHFGREYIINRMPGGGFGQANMNLKSTIYVLFYTRHKLRTNNKIDYSEEPTVPEGVKIRKLPKMPQLPKMPLFWNRISYMTAIKMLGYNVIPLEELNRNNHHPCPYEGCSEVFTDIEDYRKHYRST
ncbi:hypothetical protein PVAND_005546 [Polypedilum vanderplanki]|uniref:Uncharacterized protein n=1 Tax=Polypedilum vanderplanki TaxID=319348 RepID=A0A9J6C1H4_POLVA|nr:hypothetical protein PVAND_005546 [Polypedilum vanderplanki]